MYFWKKCTKRIFRLEENDPAGKTWRRAILAGDGLVKPPPENESFFLIGNGLAVLQKSKCSQART